MTETTISDEARYVRRRFWRKARATVGRVPFIERAVAAYYAALDPATPPHVKAALLAALAYFVLPADAIPDFVAALGYSDDAALLLGTLRLFAPYVADRHFQRAGEWFREPTDGRRHCP